MTIPRERIAPMHPEWIELVMGFQCNCRCSVCPGSQLSEHRRMSRSEVFDWLERSRREGASGVWFGGGEPSLHPDLVAGLERARALGFPRRRVQTNALRFAYPAFTARTVAAGLSEVSVSLKGGRAETHEAVSRTPGSFALLSQGVRNLVSAGARVEADLLLTRPMLPELEEAVSRFAGLGVKAFHLWLLSLHGLAHSSRAQALLPTFAELAPCLQRAGARADELGVELSSLHTPPCSLLPADRGRYRPASTWRLRVALPGGESFMAEESPMEGGHYLPDCARCSARPTCLGLRGDYLAVHGRAGLAPLRADQPGAGP
ncbi:MAG TPA: radical SAM protein [Myxococcota bacterium]|nr:radical SAM protein [Myxococcota bacterium]HRY94059.1 radical SAM protein [Myxococcota bacterium]HSA21362.1 radical SAM protein [Myxococcota bacterium]